MAIPNPADLWYRRYPERLRRATIGWPLAAKGAYSILIDYMFTIGESSIPADDRALCEIIGCSAKEWAIIKSFIARKFSNGDGRLNHTFIATELAARTERSQERSNTGRGGAEKRWHGTSRRMAEP